MIDTENKTNEVEELKDDDLEKVTGGVNEIQTSNQGPTKPLLKQLTKLDEFIRQMKSTPLITVKGYSRHFHH